MTTIIDKNAVEKFINDNDDKEWSEEHKNIIKYVCYKTNKPPQDVLEILKTNGGNYNKIIREHQENEIIEIVMRQTNYDRENAYMKLREYHGDHEKVIKNYLGVKDAKDDDKFSDKSTNQKIFNHIRDFMDNSKIEKDKQDYNNKKNEIISHLTEKALK